MTLDRSKSLSFSSTEEFLSEIEPSVMQPKNLIGLEWMEGIGDRTSGWTDAFETEKRCCVHRPTLDNDNRARFASLSEQLCTEKVKCGLQKLWQTLGLGHP